MNRKEKKGQVFLRAESPLFGDKEDDVVKRAIIAVSIGCDVSVHGPNIKGTKLGPKTVAKDISKIENNPGYTFCNDKDNKASNEALISLFSKKMKMKTEDFWTLCQAFIYEPGILHGCDSTNDYDYITHCTPLTLPKYLEAFKGPSTTIIDGPAIETCIGPKGKQNGALFGDDSHTFLSFEGNVKCQRCSLNLCLLCCTKGFCNTCYHLNCYLELVNNDEEKAKKLIKGNCKNIKTISEMRKALIDRGIQDVGSASTFDLEGLYNSIIEKEEIDILRKLAHKVVFPIKSSSKLRDYFILLSI